MYHRQQNKSYPQSCLFARFEVMLDFNCQISLQSAAANCSFSDNLTPLGVTLIFLAMEHVFSSPHPQYDRNVILECQSVSMF